VDKGADLVGLPWFSIVTRRDIWRRIYGVWNLKDQIYDNSDPSATY